MPSASSAATRLLTVAGLTPASVPTSCRVRGPLRKTCHSARDRLLLRRSRTVVVLGLGIDLPDRRRDRDGAASDAPYFTAWNKSRGGAMSCDKCRSVAVHRGGAPLAGQLGNKTETETVPTLTARLAGQNIIYDLEEDVNNS